jgi:TRAP-type C4-dicarboxylate transport system permease small subunit
VFDRVDRLISGLSLGLASLALFAALAIGVVQISSRFVFHTPVQWSESALRVALVWCIFAALPIVVRRGALLSVDFLDRQAQGTRWQPVLRAFAVLCTAVVLLVLIFAGYGIADRMAFQTIPGLGISVAYAYAIIPASALVALVALGLAVLKPVRPEIDIQQI